MNAQNNFVNGFEGIIKQAVKEALVESLTGSVLEFLSKSQELPDKPTISQAMRYLNIKSRNTFDSSIRPRIKMYNNTANGKLCCDKREIMEMYIEREFSRSL